MHRSASEPCERLAVVGHTETFAFPHFWSIESLSRLHQFTGFAGQRTAIRHCVYACLYDRTGRDERHTEGVVPDQRLKARVKTLTSA